MFVRFDHTGPETAPSLREVMGTAYRPSNVMRGEHARRLRERLDRMVDDGAIGAEEAEEEFERSMEEWDGEYAERQYDAVRDRSMGL